MEIPPARVSRDSIAEGGLPRGAPFGLPPSLRDLKWRQVTQSVSECGVHWNTVIVELGPLPTRVILVLHELHKLSGCVLVVSSFVVTPIFSSSSFLSQQLYTVALFLLLQSRLPQIRQHRRSCAAWKTSSSRAAIAGNASSAPRLYSSPNCGGQIAARRDQ